MVKKSNFTSLKNFYAIWIIDCAVKFAFTIFSFFSLPGIKNSVTKRYLIIEFAHLGDALMLTPAIRLLKKEREDSEIYCLVSSSAAKALENSPFISQINIIDLPWYEDEKLFSLKTIIKFLELIRQIKKINAETVINFRSTSYHFEHLAMWFAGVPNRIGFSHKGFGYLLTKQIDFKRNTLIAQQKVNIIETLLYVQNSFNLRPDYFIKDESKITGNILYNSLQLNESKRKIGINIGAQHNFLWPQEYWVELLNKLNSLDVELVLLGTKNFLQQYNDIKSKLNFTVYPLVGKTTLDELAFILTKLNLLVTIDTGVRHIANALSLPTIVLRNGANSIGEFGKYVETEEMLFNKVSCSPCGKSICPFNTIECMTGITPEKVFAQVKIMLNEK